MTTTADWIGQEFEERMEASVALNNLAELVHEANRRWWHDPVTGWPVDRNVGELLMLIVSELSEALEAHRRDLPDDKLPHRSGVEVELADALMRILDMSAGLNLDIGGAFVEKMRFNAERHDHTNEARLAPSGKRY